jgi:hypothetical protein
MLPADTAEVFQHGILHPSAQAAAAGYGPALQQLRAAQPTAAAAGYVSALQRLRAAQNERPLLALLGRATLQVRLY